MPLIWANRVAQLIPFVTPRGTLPSGDEIRGIVPFSPVALFVLDHSERKPLAGAELLDV